MRRQTGYDWLGNLDSITQFVLGAAIAEATLGRRVGRRAALIGGIVASLPDLDVLVPFADPVSDFTYHRSASHSLLVLVLFAPLVAWMIDRCFVPERRNFRSWWLCCSLALVTHPLLDAFTVYGTQLAWPLSEHPYGLGSMFIIDPVYTLPLIAAVLVAQFSRARTVKWNATALALTSAYLALSVVVQAHVETLVRQELQRKQIPAIAVGVHTTPFNIVAWRILVTDPSGYRVGYYSLWAPRPIEFERYASAPRLLDDIAETWPVARLAWFTKGLNAVSEQDGAVVLSDLRMGLEPNHYVFAFRLGERVAGRTQAAQVTRVAPAPYVAADWARLRQRIFGP
jgi:inner membrane protein